MLHCKRISRLPQQLAMPLPGDQRRLAAPKYSAANLCQRGDQIVQPIAHAPRSEADDADRASASLAAECPTATES